VPGPVLVSQPRQARRSSSRFYTWRDANYFGVTSIIDGGIPKHALKAWGIKMVAEGVIRNRRVLDALLAECETPDQCSKVADAIDLCVKCNATVRFLKDLPYAHTQRAQDIGTEVHAAIEAYTLNRPMPPWALAIAPRMRQFERFLAEWSPTFELAEASIFSRRFSYAGTLDAIGTLPLERITPLVAGILDWPTSGDRVRLLWDYKSSQRGIWPEVALQLAAYRYADFIGLVDGSEAPVPAVDGAMAINLTNETYRLVPVLADEHIWKVFLHARSILQWGEETSKRVLFEDLTPAPVAEAVAS
jgi:hypothetical protein